MAKQARLQRLEPHSSGSRPKKSKVGTGTGGGGEVISRDVMPKGQDHAGSPSSEASEDVEPVGHAPATQDQKVMEKSKYEAAEPYRSKKGDRFS